MWLLLAEAFQDQLSLRYCLCSVARGLAKELSADQPSVFTVYIRRSLFFAFSSWTEEGAAPGIGTCPHCLSIFMLVLYL